jgi:hypothetical protein
MEGNITELCLFLLNHVLIFVTVVPKYLNCDMFLNDLHSGNETPAYS